MSKSEFRRWAGTLSALFLLATIGLLHPPTPVGATQTGFRDEVTDQTLAPGVEHRRLIRASSSDRAERWVINVLEVAPHAAKLSLGLALDEVVGTETTSSLAQRNGALAAINGGYFRTTGTIRGEAMGLVERNGKLLSEPIIDRAAFSSGFDGGTLRVAFTHTSAALQVWTAKAIRNIDGINRPREANEVVLYTPEFHRNTLTMPTGYEVTVIGRSVRSTTRNGSSVIPARGYVLSGDGTGAAWLERNLPANQRVDIRVRAIHRPSLTFNADFSIGGGPMLVARGEVTGESEFGSFSESLTRSRHPRTAVGVRADGKLILVTVDGRQPGVSVGMTITELARFMLELRCTDAMNLDGGGSTTMVVRDRIVNQPSDATGERPVSDALMIFSRP